MKITKVKICNFRSIIEAEFVVDDFMMFVGANNSGKSNVLAALRCFYDDLSWSEDDIPKTGMRKQESWVELEYRLSDKEWDSLAEKYQSKTSQKTLCLRRIFKGSQVKAKQSNIYAVVDGELSAELFYGAKNVSAAKCGSVIYIPALATAESQFKTTTSSPFKQLVNYFIKKSVKDSPAFVKLNQAFADFNAEAKQKDGFIDSLQSPINNAIKDWDIAMNVRIDTVGVDDISKNLIHPSFVDESLNDAGQGIERFGSGFQRVVIYELIRVAAQLGTNNSLSDADSQKEKKEFSPELSLILFEEPEAFLHPAQQELMSYALRDVANGEDCQVFVSTHSAVFVGKGMGQIQQVCRLNKRKGITSVYQVCDVGSEPYVSVGLEFLSKIKAFVNDGAISDRDKKEAREILKNSPTPATAKDYDRFRFQMWLDTMRASLFFADKVLLVEGETERVLFNYLLANKWHDLRGERIFVIDALGKFNFVRYLRFFKAFGIKHGVIYDEDKSPVHLNVINPFIESEINEYTLAKPVRLKSNIEDELCKQIPGRDDQKPLEVLKMIEDGSLAPFYEKIKGWVCAALNIS